MASGNSCVDAVKKGRVQGDWRRDSNWCFCHWRYQAWNLDNIWLSVRSFSAFFYIPSLFNWSISFLSLWNVFSSYKVSWDHQLSRKITIPFQRMWVSCALNRLGLHKSLLDWEVLREVNLVWLLFDVCYIILGFARLNMCAWANASEEIRLNPENFGSKLELLWTIEVHW